MELRTDRWPGSGLYILTNYIKRRELKDEVVLAVYHTEIDTFFAQVGL